MRLGWAVFGVVVAIFVAFQLGVVWLVLPAPYSIGLTPSEREMKESSYYDERMTEVELSVRAQLDAGEADCDQALPLSRINDILLPGDLPIENGHCVMRDGTGFVAVRTVMRNVTAEMLEWWFAWHVLSPVRYKIWHPRDHAHASAVNTDVYGRQPPTPHRSLYEGNVHYVIEKLNDDKLHKVQIEFMPAEQFGFDRTLFAAGRTVAVVAARVAVASQRLFMGRMTHVARELPASMGGGVELRSRFWLLDSVEPRSPALQWLSPLLNSFTFKRIMSTASGVTTENMAKHCAAEFTHLGAILPSVYAQFGSQSL